MLPLGGGDGQGGSGHGQGDKLAEAHRRLADAVEALVTGDDWQAFLALAARLHGYSATNIWLIMSQAPWATHVAGYHTWKQLGRHVRAGEKGIAILAPCRYRAIGDNPDGDELGGDDPGGDRPAAPAPTVVRGFKVVHVFDRSQTDGPPLPEPARPALLTGEAPAGMWDALVARLADAGYHVQRGDFGTANGRTNFIERLVTVRADVDDAQAVKTLCHDPLTAPVGNGSSNGSSSCHPPTRWADLITLQQSKSEENECRTVVCVKPKDAVMSAR